MKLAMEWMKQAEGKEELSLWESSLWYLMTTPATTTTTPFCSENEETIEEVKTRVAGLAGVGGSKGGEVGECGEGWHWAVRHGVWTVKLVLLITYYVGRCVVSVDGGNEAACHRERGIPTGSAASGGLRVRIVHVRDKH